jgi:hypothetical protein
MHVHHYTISTVSQQETGQQNVASLMHSLQSLHPSLLQRPLQRQLQLPQYQADAPAAAAAAAAATPHAASLLCQHCQAALQKQQLTGRSSNSSGAKPSV